MRFAPSVALGRELLSVSARPARFAHRRPLRARTTIRILPVLYVYPEVDDG
jgi:hypothetical protein